MELLTDDIWYHMSRSGFLTLTDVYQLGNTCQRFRSIRRMMFLALRRRNHHQHVFYIEGQEVPDPMLTRIKRLYQVFPHFPGRLELYLSPTIDRFITIDNDVTTIQTPHGNMMIKSNLDHHGQLKLLYDHGNEKVEHDLSVHFKTYLWSCLQVRSTQSQIKDVYYWESGLKETWRRINLRFTDLFETPVVIDELWLTVENHVSTVDSFTYRTTPDEFRELELYQPVSSLSFDDSMIPTISIFAWNPSMSIPIVTRTPDHTTVTINDSQSTHNIIITSTQYQYTQQFSSNYYLRELIVFEHGLTKVHIVFKSNGLNRIRKETYYSHQQPVKVICASEHDLKHLYQVKQLMLRIERVTDLQSGHSNVKLEVT